jgi:hypothetical protein
MSTWSRGAAETGSPDRLRKRLPLSSLQARRPRWSPQNRPTDFTQVPGERRQLLGVLPCRFRRQSAMRSHKPQLQRENQAKPSRGKRREANAPAEPSLFVCLEEDPDGGPKTAGAAGVFPRRALGYVLTHRVVACDRQR